MSVNDPVYTLKVEAAFGADPDTDLSGATWTELTMTPSQVAALRDAGVRQYVRLAVGRHSLAGQSDPLQMVLRIGNPAGRLTPYNKTSPFYPFVVRNLPIRFSGAAFGNTPVELGTAFLRSLRVHWIDGVCVADIVAAGRLNRLQRLGVTAVSATTGATVQTNPVAYWPLTDGTSASTAASGLPGGASMSKSGTLKFGTGDAGTGQPPILNLAALKNTIGSLSGAIPAGTSETSWRAEFKLNWPKVTPTDDSSGHVSWSTTGTIAGWAIDYRHSDTKIVLRYTPADGSGPVSLATTKTLPYDGVARVYRVTADQNGTGIDVVLTIDGVSYLTTTIATHTVGHPTNAKLRTAFSFAAGYDGSQSPAVGGLTFWAPYASVGTDTILAASGYAGESAGARIQRLCDQAGIPVMVLPGATTLMGVQSEGTLLAQLRECEDADGGLLHDGGPSGSLVYIPRSARYNTTVTINATKANLSDDFSAVLDDTDLATEVTVSQTAGTSQTISVDSDEGIYPRSFSLNVADSEDLGDHASWRSALTTAPVMRYEVVPLNFRRDPQLLALWLATGVGAHVRLTSLPDEHSTDPVDVFADGYAATIDSMSWTADLDCVPEQPYEVMVLDTSTATLATAVTASSTTWTSVVSDRPRWTTTDVPLALQCGGETPIVATAIADVPITFVNAGTIASANNASVTPTLPASVVAGDLLLIWAAIRSSGAGTVNVPSGYTRMVGWHNAVLLGKIHTGTESDPTVTFSGGSAGDDTQAKMFAFRNTVADPTNCLLDWRDWLNTSAQDIAYPPMPAPKYDGCVVVVLGWKQDDFTTVAPLAGFTEVIDNATITGNDQGIVADYQIQTTATAIPSGVFSVTGGAGAISRGMVVVLAPGRSTLTVTRPTGAVAHAAGATIQVANTGNLGL